MRPRYSIAGFEQLALVPKKYPNYDRFLPVLAPHLRQGWIVDVGANVGDTLYGLLAAKDCSFLCIEPEPEYFRLLEENVASLPEELKKKIRTRKCIVTNEAKALSLQAASGTAKIIEGSAAGGSWEQRSLDELMAEYGISPEQCRLVKIDVDGHDDKCLISGMGFFKTANPIIMWESEINTHEQLLSYHRCYFLLNKFGYHSFYLFDNTGHFIMKCGAEMLRQYISYLPHILLGRTTLLEHPINFNIYYLDIVTCKKDDEELLDAVVAEYIKAGRVATFP